MSTVRIFQQQKLGIIVKMILLGGAHYVHELKFFIKHVRVSLLRVHANRMVGGAHYVHDCLRSMSGSNAIVNWSK